MSNLDVGVNLVEGIGISSIPGVTTAISGLMGTFERGPLNVRTLVTSMAQFETEFGSVPAAGSTSYYSVKSFFKKTGQSPLYVVRVASSSAAKATYSFNDGAAATLRVDAKSEGTFGNKYSIVIAADSILSTTPSTNIDSADVSAILTSVEGLEVGTDLQLYNGVQTEHVRLDAVDQTSKTVTWTGGVTNTFTTANGVITSEEFKVSLYINGIFVEDHAGLGMNPDTTFFVEKKLLSNYITGTDIKVTKVNTYIDLPAVYSATALASGADGLSDVVATDYSGSATLKTGVYAFDGLSSLFRLCCPNPLLTDVDTTVAYKALLQALIDYVDVRVTVQLYADIPYNTSVADTVTFADLFASRRLTLFSPWLKVIESGLTVWLPPSAFVMGAAVKKDYTRGVHKNVGNEQLPYATDLKYHLSTSEHNTINDAGVNAIRAFAGRGIRNYGGRTSSPLTVWRFIHYSELWNYIGKSLEIALQNIPFEPHNEDTWKKVVRRVNAFMANEHNKGALFNASDPTGVPYRVVMDSTNNPVDQVALGKATLDVEYIPTGTIEKFAVKLTSSPAGFLAG